MTEKIKERALQIVALAAIIGACLMAVYALRFILWLGFSLGFKM